MCCNTEAKGEPVITTLLRSIPSQWKQLRSDFFARRAPEVASDLLTCVLLRRIANGWMGGPICETEAYTEDDPASHTFRGQTPRNTAMFADPGTIYVYRSYGIHWCVNISTGCKAQGEAVLIRAISARFGPEHMLPGAARSPHKLASGPGRLCAALSIDRELNGQMIGEGLSIWQTPAKEDFTLAIGQRIGIKKALEKHWRFGIKGHPSLSRPFPR